MCVLLGFLLLVACQNEQDPISPRNYLTSTIPISTLITVHDYTNVTMDPGHYLLPEGYAGASLVAYTGPINVGRGGTLPHCPYDDTFTMGLFAPTVEDHAEAFDRLWFQIVSFSASATFDLGSAFTQVCISLNQDHGPYPEEALEYRVAVANNPGGPFTTLPTSTLITMYRGGWSTAGEPGGDCNGNGVLNDDYSAIWQLPGAYRYVRLTPIANTGVYNEPEVDAVVGIGPAYHLDIRPQSCPNPLNRRSNGVLPVAILGTMISDVNDIDFSTVLLENVAPLRWSIEDVSTPVIGGDLCDCTTEGPDGYDDLTLKFKAQEIVDAIGPVESGDIIVLTITGSLLDGTPFEASDCVKIVGRTEEADLKIQ